MNSSTRRLVLLTLSLLAVPSLLSADTPSTFRPPAVPLVANDPYLSIWSEADRLTDDVTRHWTGHPNPLVSLIRIDGSAYRLMGNDPKNVPALPQTGLTVLPTRSIYEFADGHVHVTLTFMTPVLPDNIDVLTRPATYLTWDVKSVDGQAHTISIYDSTSSALAVNVPENAVTWQRETAGSLTALKTGAELQTLFDPRGDDTRINWGYAYAAAPTGQSQACIGGNETLLQGFTSNGTLPAADEAPPRAAKDNEPVMAFVFDLGTVGNAPVSRHVIVAYDELYEVKFSGEKLLPFWKRDGATMPQLLQKVEADYPALMKKCQAFDQNLMADMTKVGGAHYAQICALAYRQCLAATGIAADSNKQPMLFTKENTSNGDIATVDVIFPMDPLFIFLSPTLAKASVAPVLVYANSDRWKFPNAPHDLGSYPVASATGDPGEAMPVEESGNMLMLCDAISQDDGNTTFVTPYWEKLSQWAHYLEQYGTDPEDQLCTDDFMGHLAHNSNLSIKAILGLAAYGDLCRMKGDSANADKYTAMAKADADHWMKAADDGDHYRLAFDKPNTWSQKYNLVWDKVLSLHIFPPEVAAKEIAYYKTQMGPYGIPLDSRTKIGDVDHVFFTATLADNNDDFNFFIDPFYHYLDTTSARFPLVDTYQTTDIHSLGMHARPVVGGVFIKMLTDKPIWQKWAAAGNLPAGPWAPLPPLPTLTPVLPVPPQRSFTWNYTTTKPAADWNSESFDDSAWLKGPYDAWIPPRPPKSDPKTLPKIPEVWMRTQVTLPDELPPNLKWVVNGNCDGEIYVNGQRAGTISRHGDPEPSAIYPEGLALLKPGGTVVIAAHVKSGLQAAVNITLDDVPETESSN